ncbi:type II toxin-antitoxin system ParD family antitoxin [Gluconacetobacter entanii]|uniref:CopG family transcriptional regulator n=1 Tax=Gluconacetobacter entanii TaxID=108528 RepID=A0A318PP12_9PROT|nr:type II toxin-antitoxin system ParD family antitoxin [Gluconacetobacter entanii]PYD61950.1 CopG family transcriptional regulator [Gluconacetobacter entanii]
MATMNVSLPDPMKEWVEAQARTGRYSNASDYVRDLIRRDQEARAAHDEVQDHITAGLQSSVGSRSMKQLLQDARATAGTTDADL